MNALVHPQTTGTPMLRAPSAQELGHLFALAEHEILHGCLSEALLVLRFVRSIDPSHTDATARTALVLFRREQWADAWDAFDIRFKLMTAQPTVTVKNAYGTRRDVPRWTGGPVPQKLLVMYEQGLGDTIHFARYLRFLVEKDVEVTFVTHRILFNLLKTMELPITLRPSDESGSVGGVGGWTPLLHILFALNIDPARYAENIPYIKADLARVEKWRAVLPKDKKLIGIALAGNPIRLRKKDDRLRSKLSHPLLNSPVLRLLSCKKEKVFKKSKPHPSATSSFFWAMNLMKAGKPFSMPLPS